MLPFIFEMKILKYTFTYPNLEIVDGELIESGTSEETYTFTLLFKGIGVFEELANQPLLTSLLSIANADGSIKEESVNRLLSKDFISNLACASYIKIDGDRFHNNRATAEEFKKTKAYSEIFKDMGFIEALLMMAVECVADEQKSKAKSKASTQSKN